VVGGHVEGQEEEPKNMNNLVFSAAEIGALAGSNKTAFDMCRALAIRTAEAIRDALPDSFSSLGIKYRPENMQGTGPQNPHFSRLAA
jgi:hypothetical protein